MLQLPLNVRLYAAWYPRLVFSQFTNAADSYHVIFVAGWFPVNAPATTFVIPRFVAFVIQSCGTSVTPIL
jgi:hypothetical protein